MVIIAPSSDKIQPRPLSQSSGDGTVETAGLVEKQEILLAKQLGCAEGLGGKSYSEKRTLMCPEGSGSSEGSDSFKSMPRAMEYTNALSRAANVTSL
jgi:hypothetical protein